VYSNIIQVIPLSKKEQVIHVDNVSRRHRFWKDDPDPLPVLRHVS
jgi:hypothetical protein